jgi:large subunit ribosomal protein L19
MLRKAIADIQAKYARKDVPEMRAGDTVRVHTKIKEGDKERIQIFEGVVMAYRKGTPGSSMFTVRKMSYGVGVERMFPVHSPRIDKIEVVGHGEVRRSRLYYLRERQGKAARLHQEEGGPASAAPAAPAPASPAPAAE